MSGGGGRVQKGRMSSKLREDVTPHQLAAMEKTLEAEEKAWEVCVWCMCGGVWGVRV